MARKRNDSDEKAEALRRSGWVFDTLWGVWKHDDSRDEFVAAAKLEARAGGVEAGRREFAEQVIRALGLTESYPDSTEEVQKIRTVSLTPGAYFPARNTVESYTETVTAHGYQTFMADIAVLIQAGDAEAARKRIGLLAER